MGLWTDKPGNLYVANSSNVAEYKPGNRSPTCTYQPPENTIAAVTSDDANHVYVTADQRGQYTAVPYLDVFEQCGKLIRHSRIGKQDYLLLEGVAVDANRDIFVAYYLSPNFGAFYEFVRGSRKAVRLRAMIGGNGSFGSGSGGLIVDKHQNLIATDANDSIYLIRPPYKTAHVLISNLGFPATLSLNKAETLLFSANADSRTVTAYKYPAATLVKTLHIPAGSMGVAADPDAAF